MRKLGYSEEDVKKMMNDEYINTDSIIRRDEKVVIYIYVDDKCWKGVYDHEFVFEEDMKSPGEFIRFRNKLQNLYVRKSLIRYYKVEIL